MFQINPSILYVLLGALLCLFGFILYWGGLRLVGMFLGGSIAAMIGIIIAYTTKMEGTLAIAVIAVLALLGIGIGWRLLRGVHGFLVFFIGAGLGYLILQVVPRPPGSIWAQPWVPVAAVVIGGVLSLLLFRYVIILVTSAIGAYLIYQVVGLTWVLFVAFIVGVLVQIGAFHRLGLNKKVRMRWS